MLQAIPWNMLRHSFLVVLLAGMNQKHAGHMLMVKEYSHIWHFQWDFDIINFISKHIEAVFQLGTQHMSTTFSLKHRAIKSIVQYPSSFQSTFKHVTLVAWQVYNWSHDEHICAAAGSQDEEGISDMPSAWMSDLWSWERPRLAICKRIAKYSYVLIMSQSWNAFSHLIDWH